MRITFAKLLPGKEKEIVWRVARVVDRDGLENRCIFTGTQGSNP